MTPATFSKSRKSRLPSLPRKRALRRGAGVRPVDERDVHVSLYLAYKGGTFDKIEAGLEKEAFVEAALNELAKWDDGIMLEIAGKPVGFVVAGTSGHRVMPHARWFPWASARDRIETALAFFLEYKKDWTIIVATKDGEESIFEHLKRYGVIRRIGTSWGWYKEHRTILYESLK